MSETDLWASGRKTLGHHEGCTGRAAVPPLQLPVAGNCITG